MYCTKCGNGVQNGEFCSQCGTRAADNPGIQPPQPVPPHQPAYQPQPWQFQQGSNSFPQRPPVAHYAPGSFAEKAHGFGSSVMFLVGICLFSGGTLFPLLMNFNFSEMFSLLLLGLPVAGLWLVFAASKTPRIPEKTLTALTLFKIHIIINLVAYCLAALGCLIVALILFARAVEFSSYYGGGAVWGTGFLALLIAGGIVAFSIIYSKAALQTIGGIRDGIIHNLWKPLSGLKIFTIFTYISVGLSALSSLAMIGSGSAISEAMNEILYDLPGGLGELFQSAIVGSFSGSIITSSFFHLVSSAGTVVCIVVLNQFNDSLTMRNAPIGPPQSGHYAPPPQG
ncbi:MAG: zinc ribbon domain-containing protein [Oscillospiraceae bacterium]|nr:zinc ribbon domain-containing protein [Oscillospiraceae bacterium]